MNLGRIVGKKREGEVMHFWVRRGDEATRYEVPVDQTWGWIANAPLYKKETRLVRDTDYLKDTGR